ncbi:MAG: hypothetical protein ACOX9R_12255 [Armatimonadota bacterium]|jgi:hypothetical protein
MDLPLPIIMLTVAGIVAAATISDAQARPRMTLHLNGAAWAGDADELFLAPGVSNLLDVSPAWDALDAARVEIVVEKTLPDDRVEVLRATADEGQVRQFALGPMTAPVVFEYEAGVVYQRGYTLRVSLRADGEPEPIAQVSFHQDLAIAEQTRHDADGAWQTAEARDPATAGPQRLTAGDARRVVYWGGMGVSAPLELKLAGAVMSDQDAFEVQCRLNEGALVESISCRLQIADAGGAVLHSEDFTLDEPGRWRRIEHDVTAWPPGDYAVTLWPVIEGEVWREGPEVAYRRRAIDPDAVRISPLAPWEMRRDRAREEVVIDDLPAAAEQFGDGLPEGWETVRDGGATALASQGSVATEPVVLNAGLSGHYAVFARGHGAGCLIQAGDDALIRPLRGGGAEVFITAADLTDAAIRIFAYHALHSPDSGLRHLRLVPVTAESVRAMYDETSNPPVELRGVNDWCEYFGGAVRLESDQFATIIGGQAEIGLRTIGWSIGRSWVEYHTDLPNTTRFPAVPLDEAAEVFDRADSYRGRTVMINEHRPLQSALEARARHGVRLLPWLAMQRHYGTSYGGIFASEFFRGNPQWWRWRKHHPRGDEARREANAICYFFPEVRAERVEILVDAASRGADGLLIGCCRQVPMLLYHPEMIAEYTRLTGVDPLAIDATDGERYEDWIRWRADFFTQVLRDLRERLRVLEREQDRAIPVIVRIPSADRLYNLAAGLDVRRWLEEGLVDELQLDPLEIWGGRASHDVTPWLELGREFDVTIVGGIGATWMSHPVVGLHRARGLLLAGVDGIETYETELLARSGDRRWVMPMFGNLQRLEQFLRETNAEACYPITAGNAHLAHDNHSRWTDPRAHWTVFGVTPVSL